MCFINLEDKKILIVEDNNMNFIYLRQMFLSTKANIFRVQTGYEAIQYYKWNTNLDLILMDIQLPDIDGNIVAKKIREMNKKIPIIAQTAIKSEFDCNLVNEDSCSDMLLKPFNEEQLFNMLWKYLI